MAVRTANTGTNAWNTNAAWVGGVQPTAADDVIIPSGAVVQLGNSVSGYGRSLTVQSGGTITFFNSTTCRLFLGDATAGAGNKALDIQSGATVTPGGTSPSINLVSTSTTQQTITTNGATLPIIIVNGVGSSYILGSALTSVGNFVLTAGTWNTGNYSWTAPLIDSTGTTTRTITLGSSAINCNNWAMRSTGLTITANTATLTQSGTNSSFDNNAIAGNNYNGLSLVQSGAGQAVLGPSGGTIGSITLANYTRTGTAVKTDTLLTAVTTLTVTGTFTLNSNSDINKLLVLSNLAGTTRTISAAAAVITNTVDFIDITGAGAATWTVAGTGATYLGDGQGNSGITFTTPATQTISSGSWDNAANWTSRIPLPQDDVIVTGSSAVTLNMLRIGKNLDFSGYSGTLTLTTSAGTYWSFGSVTLGASMTYGSNPNTFNYNLAGRGTHTITSNGNTFMNPGSNQTVTVLAPGGTYTLADDFSLRNIASTYTFAVNAGTFNSANYSMNIGRLVVSGGLTRSVNLGTSTITLRITSASPITLTAAGLTLSASNATFTIAQATATTRSIDLGGLEIGTLNYTLSGSTGQLNITNTGTINTLNFSDASNARTLQLTTGVTLTCRNFNVVGTPGGLMTVQSSTTGLVFLSSPLQLYNGTQDYIAYSYIQVNQPLSLWCNTNSTASNSPSIAATAPTYRHVQNASGYSASGTSVTATFVLPPTAGRLLVAYLASAGSPSGSQGTFTPPAGWTQAVTNNTGSVVYIYFKIADGTETGVAFSQTTARTLYVQVTEYSGFAGTPTLDVTDNNGYSLSTTSLSTTATTGPTNTDQPALALAFLAGQLALGNTTSITNSFIEDRTPTASLTSFKGAVKELTTTAPVSTTFNWTTGRSGTAVGLAVFKNVAALASSNGNFFQFFN